VFVPVRLDVDVSGRSPPLVIRHRRGRIASGGSRRLISTSGCECGSDYSRWHAL
jgi:hypothetical protein